MTYTKIKSAPFFLRVVEWARQFKMLSSRRREYHVSSDKCGITFEGFMIHNSQKVDMVCNLEIRSRILDSSFVALLFQQN